MMRGGGEKREKCGDERGISPKGKKAALLQG